MVGALKESLGEAINYVNAEFVAKERDISISYEKKSNISGYKNKIAVKLTTDK